MPHFELVIDLYCELCVQALVNILVELEARACHPVTGVITNWHIIILYIIYHEFIIIFVFFILSCSVLCESAMFVVLV